MKILVSDDNEDAVSLIRKKLISKGHEVDAACDGKTALELIKLKHYDLAFFDHNMPELTGMELVKYIKENRLDTKTVIITGYSDIDSVTMKNFGVDEFLVKPIKMEEIEQIVEKYKMKEG